jgi:hypothetical protein
VSKPRLHNGVLHGSRCACKMFCDPGDTKLKAARAAFLAARAAQAAAGIPDPPLPVRPRRPAMPITSVTPQSLRFRELLKAGHSAARALEIVEAECKGDPK